MTGSTIKWVPFFFDGNAAFGKIDTIERWHWLIDGYVQAVPGGKDRAREAVVEQLLQATMAPVAEVEQLPQSYFVPTDLPSFGWRREHTSALTLGVWAQTVGMDLRAAANERVDVSD